MSRKRVKRQEQIAPETGMLETINWLGVMFQHVVRTEGVWSGLVVDDASHPTPSRTDNMHANARLTPLMRAQMALASPPTGGLSLRFFGRRLRCLRKNRPALVGSRHSGRLSKLVAELERQPSWSDLPLVLITAAEETARVPAALAGSARDGGKYLDHRSVPCDQERSSALARSRFDHAVASIKCATSGRTR